MFIQVIMNGLIAGSIYAMTAIGFALVYATLRFFHLAHGAIFATGAYLTYITVVDLGVPLPVGIAIAAIVCAVLGTLIDVTAYRPLRRQRASPLSLFLCSFGIFIVLQSALALTFTNQTRSLRAALKPRVINFIGAFITNEQIVTFFSVVVSVICLYALLEHTKIGIRIRATSDNIILANYVGIDTEEIARLTIIISSVLAAIAGGLVATQENLTPVMGFSAVLKAAVASIIGGTGSVTGAILGGFIIGIGENLVVWQLPTQYKEGVALVLLTIFLLFKPNGLLGASGRREDQPQNA